VSTNHSKLERNLVAEHFVGGVGILFRDGQEAIQANLRDVGKEIQRLKPDAIIITSGHFQSTDQTIRGKCNHFHENIDPGLIFCVVNLKEQTKVWHDFSFDFHKMHPHVYEYEYPHKASASLAHQVLQHLQLNGIQAEGIERDLDHGV
jgi:4,5-DOPA dioxygenase extradiol